MRQSALYGVKVFFVLGLTVIFVVYFGKPKLQKFLKNENIVIETEEKESDGKAWAPAISVCHTIGWRNHMDPITACKGLNGNDLNECFLNATYTQDETVARKSILTFKIFTGKILGHIQL